MKRIVLLEQRLRRVEHDVDVQRPRTAFGGKDGADGALAASGPAVELDDAGYAAWIEVFAPKDMLTLGRPHGDG